MSDIYFHQLCLKKKNLPLVTSFYCFCDWSLTRAYSFKWPALVTIKFPRWSLTRALTVRVGIKKYDLLRKVKFNPKWLLITIVNLIFVFADFIITAMLNSPLVRTDHKQGEKHGVTQLQLRNENPSCKVWPHLTQGQRLREVYWAMIYHIIPHHWLIPTRQPYQIQQR